MSDKRVVTIIGGGNSGLVCAGLCEHNAAVECRVLTSKPELFKADGAVEVQLPGGGKISGHVSKVSSSAAEVVPGSDIVLWTGPVHQTRSAFETVAPHVTSGMAVGTIFAQGLTHVLAKEVFGADAKFFALRNIPWLCRTVQKGETAAVVGHKATIDAVVSNLDAAWVKAHLEPLFRVEALGFAGPTIELLDDYAPIVFNPANQIIHPARYYGLFRNWELNGPPLKEHPGEWLYRGMDEESGESLERLDAELQQVKQAYGAKFPSPSLSKVLPLRERLLQQYGDQIADRSTMAKCVGTNAAYAMAKTPVVEQDGGFLPAGQHRVVQDDCGWGLCVLYSIAAQLGVACPEMKKMIEWHQQVMKKEFLVDGKLTGRDCKELVLIHAPEQLEAVLRP